MVLIARVSIDRAMINLQKTTNATPALTHASTPVPTPEAPLLAPAMLATLSAAMASAAPVSVHPPERLSPLCVAFHFETICFCLQILTSVPLALTDALRTARILLEVTLAAATQATP